MMTFLEYINKNSENMTIHTNPGKQEFTKALGGSDYQEMRGFVDRKGDVHVWDANDGTHLDAIDSMGMSMQDIHAGFHIGKANGVYAGDTHFERLQKSPNFLRMHGGVMPTRTKISADRVIFGESSTGLLEFAKKYELSPTSYRNQNDEIEIHTNPGSVEYQNMLNKHGTLRGVIDQSDNMHVWDANKAIHYDALHAMGLERAKHEFYATPKGLGFFPNGSNGSHNYKTELLKHKRVKRAYGKTEINVLDDYDTSDASGVGV